MNQSKKKWIQPLRFQAVDETSFEEKFSFRMNLRQLLRVTLAFLLLFALFVYALFVYTPLNYLIPSWQEDHYLIKYQTLASQVDSIEQRFKQQNTFLSDMQHMLAGKDFELEASEAATPQIGRPPLANLTVPKADSLLREELGQYPDAELEKQLTKLFLSPPINNPVAIQTIRGGKSAYTIRLSSQPNEPVYSIAKGVVIQTSYTVDQGCIVIVQHANNLISIYKNAGQLLKKAGDAVESAEIIASVSEQGALDFELWEDGRAIEPEQYIYF